MRVGLGGLRQEAEVWRMRRGSIRAASCPDVQGNRWSLWDLITVTGTVRKKEKRLQMVPHGRRGGHWTSLTPGRPLQATVAPVPSTPTCPATFSTNPEWTGMKLPQNQHLWDLDELSVKPSGFLGVLWVGSCPLSLFLKWRQNICSGLSLLRSVLVNYSFLRSCPFHPGFQTYLQRDEQNNASWLSEFPSFLSLIISYSVNLFISFPYNFLFCAFCFL